MILVVLAALPAGIFLVQKQQVIKSRASVGDTITVTPRLADTNGDECVSRADYNNWKSDTAVYNSRSDFNGDGHINIKDYAIWLNQFKSGHYNGTPIVCTSGTP